MSDIMPEAAPYRFGQADTEQDEPERREAELPDREEGYDEDREDYEQEQERPGEFGAPERARERDEPALSPAESESDSDDADMAPAVSTTYGTNDDLTYGEDPSVVAAADEPYRGAEDVPEDVSVILPESAADFRSRWTAIKAGFVDDPRRAVEDTDRFVAEVAQAFTSGVESRRSTLTSLWHQDGHGQTEDLRLAMQHYRALVDQLLS